MTDQESTRETILIVEDEAPVRTLMEKYLTAKGYNIIAAASGIEALDAIDDYEFDLVLLDLILGDINGFDLLATIRGRYTQEELPIIMLTGQSKSKNVVKGFEMGANDYITKPADFSVILARVQYQLRNRKKTTEGPTQQAFSFEIGNKIGPYEIIDLLGKGGMGAVFKVMDSRLERMVALKTILPFLDIDSKHITRFTREARLIAQLNHPNIVKVFDIQEAPIRFFTMEFVGNGSLSDHMKLRTIPIDESLGIIKKIGSALETAHRKDIIHRDLKPSNILMDHKNEPKLTDFGMAKMLEANAENTKTRDMMGTPGSMAPEQIDAGIGTVDKRTDVFGLGIVLYTLVCGHPPFRGSPTNIMWQVVYQEPPRLSEFRPDIPPDLEAVCLKALEKKQDHRFSSIREFLDALP